VPLNIERTTGRSSNYKFDRGGNPTEFGPYIGEIMNNIDPTRNGRIQVYIEQFGSLNKTDPANWRTVSHVSPFGGASPKTSTSTGNGTYGSTNNQQSYGMAFSPPDIGVKVICFFIAGDPNQGFYTGVMQEQGINSMIPAVGATANAAKQNTNQKTYFAKSPQLPATEINNAEQNTAITENPQFFKQPKPVHSYVAAVLFNQGLVSDPIRGPITSSVQRESPSTVFGFSTPGRPIYQGGLQDSNIKQQLQSGSVKPEATNVVGRKGGHSFVMDDGDISGTNSLVRIRSSKGHQVTLSDDGNCIYIAHGSGQIWLEFGQEGTLDVYSTNSINLRSDGVINLHADKDINMNAGGNISMKSGTATTIASEGTFTCATAESLKIYSETKVSIKSNGALGIDSIGGFWNGRKGALILQGKNLEINPGFAPSISAPAGLTEYTLPNAEFDTSTGWKVDAEGTLSICTRTPAHEPWPYHNQGVQVNVNLGNGTNSTPPGAPTVPAGVSITKTGNSATSAQQTKAATVAEAKANPAATAATTASLKSEYQSLNKEINSLIPELSQLLKRRNQDNTIVPTSSIIALQDEIIALQKQQEAIVAKVEAAGGSITDLY